MPFRAMAPAAFGYYGPEAGQDNRHHMHPHFTSHPGMQQQQMPMFPIVRTVPSTPIYSRPSSSCSQPVVSAEVYNASLAVAMTPVASPQPLAHKPSIMLETEFRDNDYFPSTPPLSSSSSSSVISSPGSGDVLQTPLNPMFSGLDGEEGIKAEQLEKFPSVDWSSCASPPMTPGKFGFLSLFNLMPAMQSLYAQLEVRSGCGRCRRQNIKTVEGAGNDGVRSRQNLGEICGAELDLSAPLIFSPFSLPLKPSLTTLLPFRVLPSSWEEHGTQRKLFLKRRIGG